MISSPPKVLALDVGGILFSPRWRLEGQAKVSELWGVSEDAFKTALKTQKKEFYTGHITESAYWEGVMKSVGRPYDESIHALYRSYVTPVPETLEMLAALRKKYILISCNNCPKEWMEYRISLAGLDAYFSTFVTSGYVGHMKPDRKLYEELLRAADGKDLLYIDDDEKYVGAAQQQGISAKLYTSPEDLRQLIEN